MCSSPTSRRDASARAAARLPSDPVERSSTTSTVRPSAIIRSTRWEPRNPAPPITRTPPPRPSRRGTPSPVDASTGPSVTPGASGDGFGDSGIVELLTVGDPGVDTDHGAHEHGVAADDARDDRVLD